MQDKREEEELRDFYDDDFDRDFRRWVEKPVKLRPTDDKDITR